jgi:hypothetical protein
MLIASALVAATPNSPANKGPNIGWLVSTTKKDNKVLLIKVRNEIPPDVQTAKFAKTIEMHWKYAPDSKGMPAEKVVSQIAKLEAAIDPIQGDRVGYLMMIVTGNGERTWLWYVADPKAFGAALNRLVPGHPYPITLNAAATEPDWKTYRALRQKFQ